MSNTEWPQLSNAVRKYAEYYAKMKFASYEFEVHIFKVDDYKIHFYLVI